MVKMCFKIPLYEITVTLVQAEGKKDSDEVRKILKALVVSDEDLEDTVGSIERDAVNGGDTYRALDIKKMLVIFNRVTSERVRENVYDHEKRHIEDRILKFLGIDDIEAAGYLAGYLGEKFYDFKQLVHKKKK